MGVFWTHTRPSFICTHDYACHVTSLPVAANVSSYSMLSFREKPHATNLSLYPTMFPSTAWWNYEVPFMYRYCILDIILLELLHSWKVLYQWCRYIRHIILHLELSSLVLRNKFHPSFLVGDYVCNLSYKSNAFVWLEHFIRNIHIGKYLCINIWSCNYFSQYNIHPYLTETFLDAFHLYQDNIEIVH